MCKIISKLIAVLFFITTTVTTAQSFQGKAYYQTKRNVNMSMDSTKVNDALQKQLQEMLKKQFEKTYILTFSKTESLYKVEEELAKPKPTTSGIVIVNGQANDVLYKNIKENVFVKDSEEFSKNFLIKDSLKKLEWQITKETKMIGKYLCIKATAVKLVNNFDKEFKKKEKKKEVAIVAWYTPEIPVSNGPDYFGGLPGLIMELHEDKMHYVCNKIILNPSDKINIIVPTKGKVMNQKDFDMLMDKKRKEMMKNFQGGRKKDKNSNTMTFTIGG